ncbi:hypothetical protein PAHAL_6G196800 [Panicum hallii]|uniref:Uncharacterized protein n=1 Tax=Panicum hallii TaxID=206008 RepID=A0A2T8IGX4_9POAL|nr:hypothetical protein PAHAL_6G196800 [Panicum hallii]
MLLSKWSRSSTPRLASSLQSPGALRLSHLAGAPSRLAVAASMDGTTSSHQGTKYRGQQQNSSPGLLKN